MGPIHGAIIAMAGAIDAFRREGFLLDDECRVCRRMLTDGSCHTSDCEIAVLQRAMDKLGELTR